MNRKILISEREKSRIGSLYNLIKEQKEIVIHIEKQITKTSTAISLKEQEIEKLKEYKATLINSAVTGKIKVC